MNTYAIEYMHPHEGVPSLAEIEGDDIGFMPLSDDTVQFGIFRDNKIVFAINERYICVVRQLKPVYLDNVINLEHEEDLEE